MRPQHYPATHLTANLDQGLGLFKTVTSGDPLVVKGGGVMSVTRQAAGRYTVTVAGSWEICFPGPAGPNDATDNKDYQARCGPATASSDGRSTSFLVRVTDNGTDSDLGGDIPIVFHWAGHAGGNSI